MRINGRQIMALEYARRSSYVNPRTATVLIRLGLTISGCCGLTELGEQIYQRAYQRGILGGRVELNTVYKF